jgi:hypothetical protein
MTRDANRPNKPDELLLWLRGRYPNDTNKELTKRFREHARDDSTIIDGLSDLASQSRVACASMAWNTGSSSPGELEITCKTSEVAACCSNACESSRVRTATLVSASVSCGLRELRGADRRV